MAGGSTPPQPARADDAQLAVDGGRDPREVLARLERPDREHVVALGPRPVGVKTSSTAFGTTRIFAAGTASSSTSSRFVNSETAITRSAARTTRGTASREYVRVQRLNHSGCRSTARSCTVTTSGTRDENGPRKVGQWSTSTPSTRSRGYQRASAAARAQRATSPERRRARTGTSRCSSSPRT